MKLSQRNFCDRRPKSLAMTGYPAACPRHRLEGSCQERSENWSKEQFFGPLHDQFKLGRRLGKGGGQRV